MPMATAAPPLPLLKLLLLLALTVTLALPASDAALHAPPPPPPLGPAPPPQPNCTSCKWPKHSWATVPASVHTSRTDTGPDGTFTAADIAVLKLFPLVTMEKWQGTDAVDSSGERVFIWEEDAWVTCAARPGCTSKDASCTCFLSCPWCTTQVNSAAQLKAASPGISVVAWMDTMLVYTGWQLDGNSSIVNHTLNPDAVAACATGHFRPAEFIEQCVTSHASPAFDLKLLPSHPFRFRPHSCTPTLPPPHTHSHKLTPHANRGSGERQQRKKREESGGRMTACAPAVRQVPAAAGQEQEWAAGHHPVRPVSCLRPHPGAATQSFLVALVLRAMHRNAVPSQYEGGEVIAAE